MLGIYRLSFIINLVLGMSFSASANCKYCIEGDENAANWIQESSGLSAGAMMQKVRQRGVDVQVVASGRKLPRSGFAWGKSFKAQRGMSDLSSEKGILSASLCQGQHSLAEKKPVIVLASDAPKIVLAKEYLKILQTRRDPSLCNKEFQANGPQWNAQEWDAWKFVWSYRDSLSLSLQEQIIMSGELVKAAKGNSNRKAFLKSQSIDRYLNDKVASHKATVKKTVNYAGTLKNLVKEISYATKEAFKKQAYCFFVFHDVVDMYEIKPDKFVKNVTAASLPLKHTYEYLKWLETDIGMTCIRKVGYGFKTLPIQHGNKEYAIFINNQLMQEKQASKGRVLNHELLRISYLKYRNRRDRIEESWNQRTPASQNAFKDQYSDFSLSKKEILWREYYAHTFQGRLEEGIKFLGEGPLERQTTYQSFWKRR